MKITYEIYSKVGNFAGSNTTNSLATMAEIRHLLESNNQACTITKIEE
jgi:hypothetical protein